MDAAKYAAASEAAKLARRNMSVGLGSGSTSKIFIDLLGKRNRQERLRLRCIASSKASELQAKRLKLCLSDFSALKKLDIAFDGADQVDWELNLIKGLGGALVREKIVSYRSEKFVVMVGENKLVEKLSGIVPVEVIPLAEHAVARELLDLGAKKVITRMAGKRKFRTDNTNYILHADFPPIEQPDWLEEEINKIPGAVGSGLFTQKKPLVIAGREDGSVKILR